MKTGVFQNRQGNSASHAGDHPGPRNHGMHQSVLKCRSGAPESRTWWYRRAECASERSWAAQRQPRTRHCEHGTGPYVGVCGRRAIRTEEAAHRLDRHRRKGEKGVLSIVLYTPKRSKHTRAPTTNSRTTSIALVILYVPPIKPRQVPVSSTRAQAPAVVHHMPRLQVDPVMWP